MYAGERGGQIVEQTLEGPCQDCRPCYDDVVIARFGRARQDGARRLTQAPAGPIAGHRLTNPPAGRKAQTEIVGSAPLLRGSRAGLHRKGWSLPAPPPGGRIEELAPPLQLHDPGLRLPFFCHASAGNSRSSGGQPLAPLGTAAGDDAPPANGRHARTKAMPPLADEVAWLIGALHGPLSPGFRGSGP
jgi:hypothetical protein